MGLDKNMNIMYQDYENIVFVINKKWVLNPDFSGQQPSDEANDPPVIWLIIKLGLLTVSVLKYQQLWKSASQAN